MKITYLSASIISSNSANSVHVMKMCQAFAKNGHEVVLVASKGIDTTDPYDFYNVNKCFNIVLSRQYPKIFSSIFRLFQGIKLGKNSDIIYTRWNLGAVVLSLLLNKYIIFEYHNSSSLFIQTILQKMFIKRQSIIRHVFITHALKKYFLDKYPSLINKDVIVLPDGADVYEQVKNYNNKVECVYLGSFLKGKGVEIVIEIAKKMPNFKFHILGGDEKQVEFFKKVTLANNIIWYGHVPQKMAMNILDSVDIALLPNQNSILIDNDKEDIGKWTSPMKLFEYMAKGKAIIASNLDVLKEILTHEKNCILVDSKNTNEWVDAINRLENDRDLLKKISQEAKADLDNKYSWKIRAERALVNLSL